MAKKLDEGKKTDNPILNWDEFEEKIKEEAGLFESNKQGPNSVLFRGHAKECWDLSTTLERYLEDKECTRKECYLESYWIFLRNLKPALSSLTSNKYELSDFEYKGTPGPPTGYPLMIYLRHHGFPSPLLDWTLSPYVAAFFAFSEATKDENVAIYCYREYLDAGKTYGAHLPHIWGLGSYVETHKRHYLQQCEYTICLKEDGNKKPIYCSHEEVEFGQGQDILKKYIISSGERKKVMRKLDLMNINAFSLFGDEEGLVKLLAYREIERIR